MFVMGHVQGQEHRQFSRIVSFDAYDKVLDRLFPREIIDTKETDWQIVIRLSPTYRPEFQHVLQKTTDGCTLTRMEAQNFVFNALNDWLDHHDTEDVDQMAQAVAVTYKKAIVPKATANRWKNEFFKSLRGTITKLHYESGEYDRSASWFLYLHPTKYQVWFTNKSTKMSLTVNDQDIRSTKAGRLPLVRWINRFQPQTPKM